MSPTQCGFFDLAVQPDATYPAKSWTKQQFYDSVPLPPHSSRFIRVLDLDPAEHCRPDSLLTGSLRVVDLDTTPCFTALSYVWGAIGKPCHTVLCNPQGYGLEITANCHSALWSLRRRFGALTIWVDSVCINQDDEDEKAAQIPLMSRIYSGSEQTYVWLGPGNKASDRAMDYLAYLAKMRTRLPFHLVTSADWPVGYGRIFLHMWLARLRTLSEAPARLKVFFTHRQVAPKIKLDELFARDWIQRAWTFQELILSPNPVLLCGDKMLAWEDLIDFVISGEDYFETIADGLDLDILGKKPRVSADKLATWSSAITLWLTFRRHGSQSNNLDKLVRLDRANRIVRWVKFIVGLLLIPLIAVGYVVVAFIWMLWVSVAIAGPERFLAPLLASLVVCLVTVALQFKLLVTVMAVCWQVLFGLRSSWHGLAGSKQQEAASEMLHVEGVRVALRERAVSLPHDKAFSVLAILKTLGVAEVEIDYQQPISECFKHLFVAIVKLHPPALLMLCDTGLSLDSDQWTGPSWVPNWMAPPPNAGVSSQLRIPSMRRPDDTNFCPGDQYEIEGDLLRVSEAKLIGQIDSYGLIGGRNRHDGDPLRRVCVWYHFLHKNSILLPTVCPKWSGARAEETFEEQYRDSVVFALLEGLPCPQLRMQTVQYETGSLEELRTERRKPHEAPLNFSEFEVEFKDFLQFRAILDESHSAELAPDRDIARWLHQRLEGSGGAARYCHRLMAKLAKNDRTLIAVAGRHLCDSTYDAKKFHRCRPAEGYWLGTAPCAAIPGDQIFQLPKMEGCMVLRPTGNYSEFRVVGCALLPMVTVNGRWSEPITLV